MSDPAVATLPAPGTPPLTERIRRRARGAVRRALLPLWPREGETWDREAGVVTEPHSALAELTLTGGTPDDGHPYVPTPPRLARAWLERLRPEAIPRCTFVDLGSGRGRMLLMASELPFRRVVGVEFTEELHAAAQENIRRFPDDRRRCTDVESVLGDAGAFEFPDGPVVVYLDNPFPEHVMSRVLVNLSTSYRAHPRPMLVVYQQVRFEGPETATRNLDLLDDVEWLSGRTLSFGLRDRLFLRSFLVRLYSSPEVRTP